MPKYNDIDLKNWKDSEVWTDSLWIINERDKSGKHDGFYHGNFVPQIPRQLLLKYTKENDTVLDMFIGSGTTAYVCEELNRNVIGVDLSSEMVEHVKSKLDDRRNNYSKMLVGDSSSEKVADSVREVLKSQDQKNAQFVILHPPYADIIRFSEDEKDLSNAGSVDDFLSQFSNVLSNSYELLEDGRYMAIVIGDAYKDSQWVPLGFYCMNEAQKRGFSLKSIIVKNMAGNRGKQNKEGIWKYRSLANDYYVFKHEYVMIFKKGKK